MDNGSKKWTEIAESTITILAECHKHMNEIYGDNESKTVEELKLSRGLIARLEDTLCRARESAESLATKTACLVERF